MSGIFIEELNIENFKCFENETIKLNVPDGKNPGSGLTILIGENSTGKTTVLEAINYLTQSSFSTENKLSINDFRDYTKSIIINGKTSSFNCSSTIDFYKNWIFKVNGIGFEAKSRETKSRGKLLSTPFEIKNRFLTSDTYIKGDGSFGKAVDSRDKTFSNGSIINNEINIFFFDKNRTRHLSTGNYRTAFDTICDDLNWRFLHKLDEATKQRLAKSIIDEYFSTVIDKAAKGVGRKVTEALSEFFHNEGLNNLRIELLELLHPFSTAFFAIREEGELEQVKVKSLGSGIEMILTLLLLKSISDESKGSIIYLIDEPELHLHPKAQETLANLLLEESTEKQVIVSTHSPYMFKSCFGSASRFLIFGKSKEGNIKIDNTNKEMKLFPWSPSWGEMNYRAFDMLSVDFHNELYGYAFETNTDALNRLPKTKRWYNNKSNMYEDVSLSKYIRNAIHHPENTKNPMYSDDELNESTIELLKIVKATDS